MTHRQFWDGIIHLKTHATLPLTCTEEYELAQANRAWGVHSTDIYLGEKRLFVPLFCSFIQYPQDIPGTMESGKRSSGSGMRLALETRFFFHRCHDVMVTSCRTAGCLIFRGLGCCQIVNSRIPVLDLGSSKMVGFHHHGTRLKSDSPRCWSTFDDSWNFGLTFETYGGWFRNPAPADRWSIPLFIGFQPSKVVQDFFYAH